MAVGTGPKADASLILADQLIGAKLNIANGTVASSITATITHADALLSTYSGKLPYKIRTNTTQGKAMVTDATALENFNSGAQTTGCVVSQAAASITMLRETPEITPVDFLLEQNQPNPFTGKSLIRYSLPQAGSNTYQVSLKLYDVLGREVRTLVDEVQGAGIRSVNFDAGTLSGGVYYYRLTAGGFVAVRKMVIVK